jgi:hypothetical protein
MFCIVITKIKMVICKSLEINIKHDYNIIYVANMWEYVPITYKIHVCILHASAAHISRVLLPSLVSDGDRLVQVHRGGSEVS